MPTHLRHPFSIVLPALLASAALVACGGNGSSGGTGGAGSGGTGGGATASGGVAGGGTGGATASGGVTATGGVANEGTGGATASGGATAGAGGRASTGGATASGGTSASGGSGGQGAGGRNGSVAGSAGASATGGAGGKPGAGGQPATGGSAGQTGSFPTNDTFDGTALDASWTVFRPDLATIAVADGSLSIAPKSGALWYQASQADLVYKLVTGNFKATTTVHARKASNRMMTPSQFADVGGIMARNPSGSSENYILGVVGYAEMNQLAVEHKSTTNGRSEYGETAFTPDAEFRMCRVGSTFTIYYRHPGDTTWGPAFDPFERPDLPATVQVGAIAYTGAGAPDFVAIFDNFTFEPLGAGCTQ